MEMAKGMPQVVRNLHIDVDRPKNPSLHTTNNWLVKQTSFKVRVSHRRRFQFEVEMYFRILIGYIRLG